MLTLFECDLSVSLEEVMFIAIVNLSIPCIRFLEVVYDIFQVWFSFYDHYIHIQNNSYYKNY